MSITYDRRTARAGFGILAALGLLFSMFAIATPAFADGNDSSAACMTAINVDAEDSGQSEDVVTYTAAAGWLIDGICIKSGSEAFGDEKHSGVIDEDGTYEDCYEVEGIGTNEVTVTRTGEGSDCKGISHVDVIVVPKESPAESPDESPAESPSESPIESPIESPDESPAESPSESPSESPIESPSESPSSSPREDEEGGNPTATPGGGTIPDTALGSTSVPAWPFALLFMMSLSGLLVLRLTSEEYRSR